MKKHIGLFVVLCFMLLTHSGRAAQDHTVIPLPFAKELSSREITTLHQDREGFVWVGTTCGVARYDGYETVVFKADHSFPERLTDNYITPITDSENYVFIGTKSGLNVFDKRTWQLHPAGKEEFLHTEIKYVFADSEGVVWIATAQALYECSERLDIVRRHDLGAGVTSVCEDRSGNIWILTWGKGLFRWDRKATRLVPYSTVGHQNIPFVLFQDKDGHYWLGTWGDGLFRFRPELSGDDMFEPVRQVAGCDIVFDIAQDDHTGHLWMLSYNALFVFGQADGVLFPVREDMRFDRNRMFSKILKDQDGDLWLGAYDNGYFLSFNREHTEGYTLPDVKAQTGFDTNINCMYEDDGGILWFNQERHGIALYNVQSGACNLSPSPEHPGTEVNFIVPARRGNAAWMASAFIPTVMRAVREGMHIRFTDTLKLAADGKETGHIIGIHEDRKGFFWTLTERKLFVHDPERRIFLPDNDGLQDIRCLAESPGGTIWLGGGNGNFYKVEAGQAGIRIKACYKCPQVLDSRNVPRFLCIDGKERLWLATTLGELYSFDPDSRRLADHTEKCLQGASPVINLSVMGEDIWVVTPSVAIRYNPEQHIRKAYATDNRHNPVQTYRNTAVCSGIDGSFYVGGHGGFIALASHAEGKTDDLSSCRVRLTNLRIGGESVLLQDSVPVTVKPEGIVLPPSSSYVELSFSTCRYVANGQERFACMLDGWDSGWIVLKKGEHTMRYDRLPKGEYTLRLSLADDSGMPVGEMTTYKIVRCPAWFETWYAFLIYIIIGIALLVGLAWGYAAGVRRKNARLLREELARTKLEYFTNMSHELLTPLTVLSCLADEIGQKGEVDLGFVRALRDNTTRLKKLIRQVLDFRKVEKNCLPLQVCYDDASSFIRRIGRTDFMLVAQKKQLTFSMDIEPGEIYGYYDADKLEEMLFNLLSNAIKYTPEGKAVGIRVRTGSEEGRKMLYVDVWDEGIGIAESELGKIFTRFYRPPRGRRNMQESNGIGLSLTQELVKLHHGSLGVQSRVGKGTVFRLSLPLAANAYASEEILEGHEVQADGDNGENALREDRPSLLIVDDNREITEAIVRLLGHRYRITGLQSAEEAEAFLQEKDTDLIVCDLMMPGTDGMAFCRKLKSNLSTSHIPFIMLTAQDTGEVQSACYDAGADGFIAKPFDSKVLVARIDNLLHLYGQWRKQFLQSAETDTVELPYQSNDKRFLEELVATIEHRMQDADLSLDTLAEDLSLSKSTVNRKIKSMTGLTPMDFVKNIRIKSACRLLRIGGMNISEVAYAVGFSDPKYFSKCFKEERGMTPTQYLRGL